MDFIAQHTTETLVLDFVDFGSIVQDGRIDSNECTVKVVAPCDVLISIMGISQREVGESLGEELRRGEDGVPTFDIALNHLPASASDSPSHDYGILTVRPKDTTVYAADATRTVSDGLVAHAGKAYPCQLGQMRPHWRSGLGLQSSAQNSFRSVANVDIVAILASDLKTTIFPVTIFHLGLVDDIVDNVGS